MWYTNACKRAGLAVHVYIDLLGGEIMYIISNNEKFKIFLPKKIFEGENLRGQTIEVNVTLREQKEASVYDLALAISECFAPYDVNYRKWAPNLLVHVCIGDKTIEFDVDWQMEDSDYIKLVADQFKL